MAWMRTGRQERGVRQEERLHARSIGKGCRRLGFPFLCGLAVCCWLLCTCLVSNAQTEDESRADFAKEEQGLRLVIVPVKNAFILREQFKPVTDFLSQKIGRNIYLEVAPDYMSAVNALVDKEADAAFLGSYSYLLAHQRAGVEPLARPVWPENKNVCRSYIIARKNSNIRDFPDMAEKRLAIADMNSFSGFIFASCILENNGIADPKGYFDKIILAGSHDTVIWSVVTGEADVGVAQSRVYDALLREYPELVDKLFIISRSAELPAICLVTRPGFPTQERERLFFLLSQMDKTADGKLALDALGATAFERALDADYDPVRKLLEGARCAGASIGVSPSAER